VLKPITQPDGSSLGVEEPETVFGSADLTDDGQLGPGSAPEAGDQRWKGSWCNREEKLVVFAASGGQSDRIPPRCFGDPSHRGGDRQPVEPHLSPCTACGGDVAEIDGKAVREIDHSLDAVGLAEENPLCDARRRSEMGAADLLDQFGWKLRQRVGFQDREAGRRQAEAPRHRDQVAGMGAGPEARAARDLSEERHVHDQAVRRGAGVAPESLERFLRHTIGLTDAPKNFREWLDMPEEDIVHVTNGEVWYDPSGRFTRIRESLSYYPEPVWLRRIAHWCRYFSGMGAYALNRALMRGNMVYATTAFSRATKLSMEIAFLLNRRYFPYDKWLYPSFKRLPHLAPEMTPLIDEATQDGTTWERRFSIFEQLHSMLDGRMVELGLVRPHPTFKSHETSGYHLLEWCYRDLLRSIPRQFFVHTPLWDQKYMEQFVAGYVADLSDRQWQEMLHLEEA